MSRNPEYMPTDGLTIEEDKQLTELLSKWGGGRLSTPVFTELAGIIPQSIVEVVLFRVNNETLETLLMPRPEDDIVWPGMFHTPGTAIRTADFHRDDQEVLNSVFERIEREINSEFAAPPTFVGRLHRLVERGPEVAEIYIAQLLESSDIKPNLLWYPVNQLANNPSFIQSQLGHVIIAQTAFTLSPL